MQSERRSVEQQAVMTMVRGLHIEVFAAANDVSRMREQ